MLLYTHYIKKTSTGIISINSICARTQIALLALCNPKFILGFRWGSLEKLQEKLQLLAKSNALP